MLINQRMKMKSILLAAILLVLTPFCVTLRADEPQQAVGNNEKKTGAKSLFIGHSFFVPIAKRFDQLAKKNQFQGHSVKQVFAPGPGGAPAALWKNEQRKKQIEDILATGDIQRFGMTSNGRTPNALASYQNWIDMALKYNKDVKIFIGQPYVPGGPKMATAQYVNLSNMGGDNVYQDIVRLRQTYPDVKIDYLNYGLIAAEMKLLYDAGNLPDITRMTGFGSDALYRDKFIGHAGSMMSELCAITWIDALYDVNHNDLTYSDYESDVGTLLDKVMKANAKYE